MIKPFNDYGLHRILIFCLIMPSDHICSRSGCNKPATKRCPVCSQYNFPDSYFCSQECLKLAWKEHKKYHDGEIEKMMPREFKNYKFTGSLRPGRVSPMMKVPDHIPKPDYALTGHSKSEEEESSGIEYKTEKDIQGMREACRVGREVLDIAGSKVRPGITTEEIDKVVFEECIKRNAYPSPLNYYFFPKSVCTSVNEVVCHGIPDSRVLQSGDIVNLDITVYYKGYHGDLNETFLVGRVSDEDVRLVECAYESLRHAISNLKPNMHIKDVGNLVSDVADSYGYYPDRNYCGHGIGKMFHCNPNVPHYRNNNGKGRVRPGMVFTIEPMINKGNPSDQLWPDNWTVVTTDGKRSAQFEHTLLVTEDGLEILTASPKYYDTSKPVTEMLPFDRNMFQRN